LDATRDLILKGSLEPTTTEIAHNAGVTTRTLFRHFSDAETLHREMIAAAEANAEAVVDEPFPLDIAAPQQWQRQLTHIIDRRSRIYEHLLPIYVSPIFQRQRTNQGHKDSLHLPAARRRKRLNQVLPAELRNNKPLFEAIDATLGMEFWMSLRHSQQLSARKARQAVTTALTRLITDPSK
jgi:AcrR family transcriptional regulator